MTWVDSGTYAGGPEVFWLLPNHGLVKIHFSGKIQGRYIKYTPIPKERRGYDIPISKEGLVFLPPWHNVPKDHW